VALEPCQDVLAPDLQGAAESGDLGDRTLGEGGDDLLSDPLASGGVSAWYIDRSCW